MEALDKFEAQCVGFGRGTRLPAFDFMSYAMTVKHETWLSMNQHLRWMSKFFFRHHQEKNEGLDATAADAKFAQLLESMPKSRINVTNPERPEILYFVKGS